MNIKILHEVDTQALTVTGGYGRLRLMFLIALDNAVKFSPTDSEIHVSLKNKIVTISNKSDGIVDEDLPHIFDRFYKAKSEEIKNGSGLGLAIA